MDPNANLEEQRRLADLILNAPEEDAAETRATELAELVVALDEWIGSGGFLPAAWSRP